MHSQSKVHTTLNLSRPLMKEAKLLFKDKTKTQIIHEALDRLIKAEKLSQHFKKWQGKGSFKSHG